jgi:Ubiquitin-2 like Rad60 SUMO-like
VFRSRVSVPAENDVLIKFEGDVLDPAETVKSLELEGEEMLDVEVV